MKVDDRRSFIEHMFGVDRFDKASKQATEDRKEAKKNVEFMTKEETRLQTTILEENARIEPIQGQISLWNERNASETRETEAKLSTIQVIDRMALRGLWDVYDAVLTTANEKKMLSDFCKGEKGKKEIKFQTSPKPLNEASLQKAREDLAEVRRMDAEIEKAKNELDSAKTMLHDAEQISSQRQIIWSKAKGEIDRIVSKISVFEQSLRNQHDAVVRLFEKEVNLNVALTAVNDAKCESCGQTLPAEMIEKRKAVINAAMSEVGFSKARESEQLMVLDSNLKTEKTDLENTKINEVNAKTNYEKSNTLAKELKVKYDAFLDAYTVLIGNRNKRFSNGIPQSEYLNSQERIASDYAAAKAEYEEAVKNYSEAEAATLTAQKELSEVKKPAYTREELAQFDTQEATLIEKKASLKSAVNPYASQLTDIQERIKKAITDLGTTQKSLGDERMRVSYLDTLCYGFSRDMRIIILRQMIPMFNRYLSDFMSFLIPSASLKFDEELASCLEYEEEIIEDAKQLNRGSRARINLAIALATFEVLKRVRRSAVSNVVFYDEVLDEGLDGDGQMAAMELFRNMKQTVFVVSHTASLADEFDSAVMVKRGSDNDSELVDSRTLFQTAS